MSTKAIVFAASCSALVFGCGSEPQEDSAEATQEIIENLSQVGYPDSEITVVDGQVYAGHDAVVSLEASREMLETGSSGTKEQFRTAGLVSPNVRTICINGAQFTGKFGDALNRAINNYNAVGLSFQMRRTAGNNAGCNAVIAARLTGGSGGFAGFPAGGLPFNNINIGVDLNAADVNVVEHVITHELGHTIGFRHSDFFNRAISCGGAPANEGGGILIPGTPSNAFPGGSIMNSCFRSTETGEFTGTDITALRVLY